MEAKKYGLIGNNLIHSFSSSYFTKKFSSLGLQASYNNLEFKNIDLLHQFLKNTANGYSGLNVTVPYKKEVLQIMDQLDEHAEEIGAVNCIEIDESHGLKGYNTDYLGFLHSVSDMDITRYGHAYILGSGGASLAVIYALEKFLHIPTTVVSRSGYGMSYSDFNHEADLKECVIINTTPIGTYPDIMAFPEISYQNINHSNLCIDLIYNPDMTQFLKRSALQGAKTKNGYDMLVKQAEESWRIWTEN